jgi:hypothetical protein
MGRHLFNSKQMLELSENWSHVKPCFTHKLCPATWFVFVLGTIGLRENCMRKTTSYAAAARAPKPPVFAQDEFSSKQRTGGSSRERVAIAGTCSANVGENVDNFST